MQGIGGALGDAIPSCFWTKAEARMAKVPKSAKDPKKRFESAYPLLCFSLSLDPCINGDKGFLVVFNFRQPVFETGNYCRLCTGMSSCFQ